MLLLRKPRDRRQRLRLGIPERSPVRRVLEICDIGSVAPIADSADAAAEAIFTDV